jgi:dienelactone hydrolase
MPDLVRLPLRSTDGRPLPHKFYRHAEESAGLLVAFPGNLYGSDGALLFYPSVFLGGMGWDTLALSYGFQSTMAGAGPEAVASAVAESTEAVRAALKGRSYPRIGLIGKSLGCGIVAELCISVPALAPARAVYLTPMLGTSLFDPLFTQTHQPAYIAQGTADGFHDPEDLEALRRVRRFSLTLVEGADHSLVVPGDLGASIAALERVTREAISFLTGPSPAS